MTEPDQFWRSVWTQCDVIGDDPGGPAVVGGSRMPGARWFPGARLNFAENLLRFDDSAPALIACDEHRPCVARRQRDQHIVLKTRQAYTFVLVEDGR